ncbi:MAG: DNA-directed RNA polymerase subunit beta [Candidatus Gracilibacteria bacterium]
MPNKPAKAKKAVPAEVAEAPKAKKKDEVQMMPEAKPTSVLDGRNYYTQDKEDYPYPDLLEVQTDSYRWFLEEGIRELLDEVSPISDVSGKKIELYFKDYELERPRYTVKEVKLKNLNYEAALKVHVQMVNKETGEIKEQDIFLGGIPLMTERGTFIINGIERVVVNQIVRSQGVFFVENPAAPGLFNAKVIPKRGAWLEIETDKKGLMSVKIDRKRKIPITALLRAFGYKEDKEIISLFKDMELSLEDDAILRTLEKDPAKTQAEACQLIYKRIRPGDLATAENARALIESMFFDFRKYDMGVVARYKINKKFQVDLPFDKENRILMKEDLVRVIRHVLLLNKGDARPDDIDHLSNRRVRSVGELVQNKFRIGLLRTERIVRDRLSMMDLEAVTPTQLINSRPLTASLKEFFTSSQLSQFMDQTNPLSELEHKRRISAMGPGGLSRERASFEVRDVHTSHYGRICPIATPEGPNIGLVVHLATYARVNKYGFIETPYRGVNQTAANDGVALINRRARRDIVDAKGKVIVAEDTLIDEAAAAKIKKESKDKEIFVHPYITEDVKYFDAEEEERLYIAQASSLLDVHGNFVDKRVPARHNADPNLMHRNDITHIDISPRQIVSVTTALIPFAEHDDATRLNMGSIMQRQVVPPLRAEAPVVGTGMERVIGRKSGYVIEAEEDGEVMNVDATKVVAMYKSGKKKTYFLETFTRSNQSTVLHQKPVVFKGQKLKKGDVLVDGSAIDHGELSLGRNLLVAYMPWFGYNYEDAIIVSKRVFENDLFSSIHIEDFSIDVHDTKLGAEIITRDIPNVGDAKLKDLDEDGIVRIGATIKEGDILVGKITPKGETEITAEERLLQAIFGEKAKDVKDTSLRLPGGEGGKVVAVHILTRQAGDDLPTGVLKQIKVFVAQWRKIEVGDKMAGRHGNKGVISNIVAIENMPYLADGTPVDIILNPLGVFSRMNIGQLLEVHLGWAAKKLGIKVATPVLNGITNDQIQSILEQAGLPASGKAQLYDGLTGEAFKEITTVGITYMMKLHHLVEDKIHARSVGPYSLVTQQPLGGKAQHGGQRFGEMEVWALEAYGAAYTLQEMLTIKSDDVLGRAKAYESIVKGEPIRNPNIPASFNVLVKELQSLGLRVDLLTQEEIDQLGQIMTFEDAMADDDE